MRIGVTPGKYAQQLYDALRRRVEVQAEVVPPKSDGREYDLVVAVDDENAPEGAKTRRYITHHNAKTSSWDVVAARHLLPGAQKRGTKNPIAVPLPVTNPAPNRSTQTGLALFEDRQKQAATEMLKAAGHQVLNIDDPDVGIVVDLSATMSSLERLRQAMSQEKVVIAMASNPAATDTIRDKSDGRLISTHSELIELVDGLLNNDFERQRLGFEARKAAASTSWTRVIRALLLEHRRGLPVLEHSSYLAARKRWIKRLGHAHPWKSAEYVNDSYLELGDQRIDVSHLSRIRKLSIAIAVSGRDPYSSDS